MPTIQLASLAEQGFAFATFPEVHMYEAPGNHTIQHLLYGDYITPPKKNDGSYKRWTRSLAKQIDGEEWIQVRSRGEEGWVKLSDLQLNRILEVNFVDIGQGDGCHLVTPDDQHFIIDAGESDNMYRFLRWRFNLNKPGKKLPKFYGVISHPDEDHWKGFEPLLSRPPAGQNRQLLFDTLYHNGILQRTKSTIGATIREGNNYYLTDFLQTQEAIEEVLDLPGAKSNLEKFLIKSLERYPALKLETLWKEMGEENILYEDGLLKLEVLAPVPEWIHDQWCLRWLDAGLKNISKTKNGHSIVLMAHIGKMKILLGGDLNSKSADYLMAQYSGRNIWDLKKRIAAARPNEQPALQKEMDELIAACRHYFQAEVSKSCHHGSHDITNEFLRCINPIATVISSGDEESHCHPRPETLGAIGKCSRGERPLIYSTELSRSSPEYIQLESRTSKPDLVKQRIVSTYGMITLRTDGERAILSQKLEKNRSAFGKITKWQIDKLVWNKERQQFVSL